MSTSASTTSLTVPTKSPIPQAYTGLPDAPTFARLASRPDRVFPDAQAFFNAWLDALVGDTSDARGVRVAFAPIGAKRKATRPRAAAAPAVNPPGTKAK